MPSDPTRSTATSPPQNDPFPAHIIWSAPATTPPLSEEEIKDIRQTLHLLQDLLRRSTSQDDDVHNDDNDAEDILDVANITTSNTTALPIRKRDKAKRLLKGHGPRIVGAAMAVGLGVLNVVTSFC